MTGTVGYTGSLKTIIDGKAPLTSPAFTGTPTIGGATVAKITDITAAITALIGGASAAYDTLGELATQLTSDENAATTLATLVGSKAALLTTAATRTTAATLTADTVNPVNAATAAVTVTLPTPTKVGQVITVEKIDTTANLVTIAGTLRGTAATSMTISTQYESIALVAESLTSWRPFAGHRTKTAIDTAIAAAVTGQAATDAATYVTYDGTNLRKGGTVVPVTGSGTTTPSAGDIVSRLPTYGQPPTSFVLEPAPTSSAVVAGDDFAGTASTSLAGRSSDLGTAAAWTVVSGTWQIDGAGNVSPTTASDGNLAVITAVPAANAPAYTVEVTTVYSFSGAGVGNSPALVVRYVDASNFWYLSPQAGVGYVSAYQVQSGTHTERARFPFPAGLTSGATVTYRIDVWQEDLTFFVNGVEQATFTSPTTGLGSRVIGLRQGISGAYGTPAKWSNLRVSTYKGTKYTFPRLGNTPSVQVLARGTTGTWEDADLNNPDVVWDPNNGRWVLYYSGFQSGSAGVQQGLGLAYASTLTGTWVKDPNNPIVTQAGGNVENGALAWTAGRWLRATEQQSGATFWQTSPDLTTWTSVTPIGLTRGVHDPYMRVNQNGLLELWYGNGYPTNAQIYKATSTDGGLSWSDGVAPVLGPPPLGNGTYRGNGEPSVYALPGKEGVELVILTDVSSPTGKGVICAAITTDAGQTWHWRNVAGAEGTGFASFQKFDSNPVFAEGQFHVFHSGGTASGDGVNLGSSIGRMSSPWTPNPRSIITVAAAAPTVPDAPTGLTATPSSTQVALSWTAPAGNGAAITDYKVEYLPSGGAWTVFPDGVSTATTATVTGLTNGTSYSFRVSAINSVGTGPVSATASATPATAPTAPAAPTGLTATPGNLQATLSWTAPASNGGAAITDYVVQYRATGAGSWSTFTDGVSTATNATVTGLTNGTGYDFQVAAVNSVGTGTYSATATATPVSGNTVPGAPTGLTATAGNGQATLSWTAPASTGGTAITDYVVQYSSNGGTSWTTFPDGTSTATTATVTGLTNATAYTFQVAAVNAVGTGNYSGTATATPTAGTTSITDSFTRADSTSTLGTTETGGQTWATFNGTWGISGGKAYNAGNTSDTHALVDVGSANQTLQVTPSGTADSGDAILFRATGTAGDKTMGMITNTGIYYTRTSGGGFNQVASVGGMAWAANDVMKVVLNGTAMTVYKNGAQVYSGTNTMTGTKAGFRADSNSPRFDDFSLTTP